MHWRFRDLALFSTVHGPSPPPLTPITPTSVFTFIIFDGFLDKDHLFTYRFCFSRFVFIPTKFSHLRIPLLREFFSYSSVYAEPSVVPLSTVLLPDSEYPCESFSSFGEQRPAAIFSVLAPNLFFIFCALDPPLLAGFFHFFLFFTGQCTL